MTKWEYLIVQHAASAGPAGLNDFGRSGWEMVAVGIQHTTHFCYFKRPLQTMTAPQPARPSVSREPALTMPEADGG